VKKLRILVVIIVLALVLSGCKGFNAGNSPSQQTSQSSNNYPARGIGFAKEYSGIASFNSVQEMPDGGYILVGDTSSWDGSTISDIFILKISSNGEKEWAKAFGKNNSYNGTPVVQLTNDGGYFVAGLTGSYVQGSGRFIIVKFNSKGEEEWAKAFGIGNRTIVSSPTNFSIQQTYDNGFIVSSPGGGNFFVLKLDSKGNKEWLKVFDDKTIIVSSLRQTKDGGYIIGGAIGDHPIDLLIKLGRSGCIEWAKRYKVGAWGNALGNIEQTSDGGYMFFDGSLIVKLDENGNEEWRKVFGGYNGMTFIRPTNDGGYIAVGEKNVGNENNSFIIKLDSKGNTEWAKLTAKDYDFRVIQQTTDGGYIAAGIRAVFKFDSRGNIGKNCNYLKDYEPEKVSNPFKVEVTDITKDIKMVPESSFRSTSVNLSFYPRDIQVTTICSGE
jgi:hypothetical protein